MIEIRLEKNYSKKELINMLIFINQEAPRKLYYTTDAFSKGLVNDVDIDVNITNVSEAVTDIGEDFNHISWLCEEDLWIIINDSGFRFFYQGEEKKNSSLANYIKDIFKE